MIHKLCKSCVNDCKQTAVVKIARCPKYIRCVSETEFRTLIDDFDELGKKTNDLKARAKKLVDMALAHRESGTDNGNDERETANTGDSIHDEQGEI